MANGCIASVGNDWSSYCEVTFYDARAAEGIAVYSVADGEHSGCTTTVDESKDDVAEVTCVSYV